MGHLDEPYYCSEQIPIPPELPDILKQFTKAAIRTQPSDLLSWSASYFRCLANNQTPPVKERIEFHVATQKTDSGLTTGLLKVLHRQLGPMKVVPLKTIEDKWKQLNLPKQTFETISHLGSFEIEAEWIKFLAIACSTISKDLTETMSRICEVLTSDPPGSTCRIRFDVFKELLLFLVVNVEKASSTRHVDNCLNYLQREWVERQEGYVSKANFLHPECPKLNHMI